MGNSKPSWHAHQTKLSAYRSFLPMLASTKLCSILSKPSSRTLRSHTPATFCTHSWSKRKQPSDPSNRTSYPTDCNPQITAAMILFTQAPGSVDYVRVYMNALALSPEGSTATAGRHILNIPQATSRFRIPPHQACALLGRTSFYLCYIHSHNC